MSRAEEMAAKLKADMAAKAPAAEQQPETQPSPRTRSRRTAAAAPESGGWQGARPRARVQRTPLNVGMPIELDIHARLARLKLDTGISSHDATAEALDQWLTAHGYPREDENG